MRRVTQLAGIFLLITAASLSLFHGSAKAANPVYQPYFTVKDGDVWTGGWFDNAAPPCASGQLPSSGCRDTSLFPNTSCSSVSSKPGDSGSYYQAPQVNGGTYVAGTTLKGGIVAYTKANNNKAGYQSGTDMGAFALGLISNQTPTGFSSNSTNTGSDNKTLSFANYTSINQQNYGGGLFAGTTPQTHCIPDYFYGKQTSPKKLHVGDRLKDLGNGQYLYTQTDPKSLFPIVSGGSLKLGQNITFFIKGNVYITDNIKYPGATTSTVPHFALVVMGNIYVDPGVSLLNGVFIAEPDQSSTSAINQTGEFWTCHDSSLRPPTMAMLAADCAAKPLEVDGAVIAKQVNLTRTSGSYTDGGQTPAETFNLVPGMYLGGGFFNVNGTGEKVKINSIINLPPVF